MLKCGDVIKCSRVRRMNIAIDEVLVILGIAPTKNGIYIAYKNKEDKDKVKHAINNMIDEGIYKKDLWS